MMVVALLATSVIGAVAAAPSVAQAWSCNCLRPNLTVAGSAYAGRSMTLFYELTNDSDETWTDIRASVTLPEGVTFNYTWGASNDSYDPATRTVTAEPRFWSNDGSNTAGPGAQTDWVISVDLDETLANTTTEFPFEATYVDSTGLERAFLNTLSVDVLKPGEDFDYRTELTFTPTSTDYNGTSVLTAKVYNDGPGKGGDVFAEIYFDEDLTLTSDLPDGCTDYGIGSNGYNIDCTEEVPEGGSDVGLIASWSFTLKAPEAPLPVALESDTFEATLGLGCSTSGAAGNDEIDEDNNSDSAILAVPLATTGQLAVVRNLPIFVDQPGVTTNPTAGRSMSSSVDVFNVGTAAVTGPVTVVIAPTAGFTPTSISATSEDSTTPAPSCVLATLTCTFSQFGPGLTGRIVLAGDLAPTIADGSEFSSSVTVSADGFDPDTDTATTTISAVAEGFISISSVTNAEPGAEVAFGVTSANAGPSTMADPMATISVPEGVTIVDLPENCTQSGNTLTCTLGDSLDAEQDFTFNFVAGLPDAVGDFKVEAVLSSSTPLAETSSLDNDHVVVTDLIAEDGALPYTGSNSTMLALVGGGLALGGLILVRATGTVARRRND